MTAETGIVELGDVLSFVTIASVFANMLPPIAAGLAIIWTLIRIYEWVRFRIFGKTEGGVFK